MSDFEQRFRALEAKHRDGNAFDKAYAFLDFHLEWAAALEKADPEGAVRQYALAEECQWTIGTGATSGGEGLASMTEVYRIMGLRADVLERLGRRQEALKIWTQIAADPNGLGDLTTAASRIARLK